MLKTFFKRLISHTAAGAEGREAGDEDALDRHAPRLGAEPVAPPDAGGEQTSFLCRESLLGRDQRIAAYHFLLHEGARNRGRVAGRRIQNVYAEVLVRNIAAMNFAEVLGSRLAFIDLPDSFLTHPVLDALSAESVVICLSAVEPADAPSPTELLDAVRALRKRGMRIAIPDPLGQPEFAYLLEEIDYVLLVAPDTRPARLRDLVELLHKHNPRALLVARGIPSLEDFQLCYHHGVGLFQGAFVTARGDWSGKTLGANSARLVELLNKLRRDAESREVAQVLKLDPALSVRLLRYINSAAVGLPTKISSIEHALSMLGREKLLRWLMLLLYNTGADSARAEALLEGALIRARLMELLGHARPAPDRNQLYLTGLLSLIDLVLEIPLDRALESLGTAPEITAALLEGQGWIADYFAMAIATEAMDPEPMDAAAQRCGVSADQASQFQLDAMAWAMAAAG